MPGLRQQVVVGLGEADHVRRVAIDASKEMGGRGERGVGHLTFQLTILNEIPLSPLAVKSVVPSRGLGEDGIEQG